MDTTTQNLDCNETINQFGVELTSFGMGMNVKELTHSQQQPRAPKTHKKKPTITQAIRKVFCATQRSLFFRVLVLDEVKCKIHTQQSTSSSESLRFLI